MQGPAPTLIPTGWTFRPSGGRRFGARVAGRTQNHPVAPGPPTIYQKPCSTSPPVNRYDLNARLRVSRFTGRGAGAGCAGSSGWADRNRLFDILLLTATAFDRK